MSLCKARVWASGDMDDCGKPATRADRCEDHALREVAKLRHRNNEIMREIRDNERRIDELTIDEDTSRLRDSVL